jgi:hypothetical protein
MTKEGKQMFDEELKLYQTEVAEQRSLDQRIDQMITWMRETISQAYQEECMELTTPETPGLLITTTYDQLSDKSKVADAGEMLRQREHYQTLVKPLKSPVRDFDLWIANWEQQAKQAKRYNVLEMQQPIVWHKDLVDCLAPAYPDASLMLYNDRCTAAAAGLLKVEEAAQTLRQWAIARSVLLKAPKQGKIRQGAFQADKATHEEQEGEERETPAAFPALDGRGRGRGRGYRGFGRGRGKSSGTNDSDRGGLRRPRQTTDPDDQK